MAGEFANTQDLVEVKEIKADTIILKDGGLRQVVMVGGTNFALKSEEEQNVLLRGYQDFLNGLSFPIQIVVHSRKININPYLDRLEELKQRELSPILQDQISEYREFVKEFVADNPIMTKTFFVVVPFYPVNLPGSESVSNALGFLPFFKKPKVQPEEQKMSDESFGENLEQLAQRVDQVANGLGSMGLEVAKLNSEQLTEMLYNFYNPETVEKRDINRPK